MASDSFLGWTRGKRGRDFYVRQLRDVKISAHIDSMETSYCGDMRMLADGRWPSRTHARGGPAQAQWVRSA